MGPTSKLACPATDEVDGRVFGNYDDYPASRTGGITLRDALAYSCNTAFIGAASQVDAASLASAALDLGIGVPLRLGVDAFAGSVPSDGQGTAHAAALIGQGEVLVTPLVMAVAAASIGAGSRVTPHLVNVPEAGTSDYGAELSQLTGAEAETLRDMMGRAVAVGTAGVLAGLPGEIAAKTGTAEYGTDDPPRTHAWMIAVDATRDLAVAVLVEDGGSGGSTAGPLLATFLEQVGIPGVATGEPVFDGG
jgi:cell division protein FtsI/penicillin-binding protein 2